MIWRSDTFTKIHQKREHQFASGQQGSDPGSVSGRQVCLQWGCAVCGCQCSQKKQQKINKMELLPRFTSTHGDWVRGQRSINLRTFILKNVTFFVPNGREFETLLRDADVVKTSSHILHILLEIKCSTFLLCWLLFSSVCADSFI